MKITKFIILLLPLLVMLTGCDKYNYDNKYTNQYIVEQNKICKDGGLKTNIGRNLFGEVVNVTCF